MNNIPEPGAELETKSEFVARSKTFNVPSALHLLNAAALALLFGFQQFRWAPAFWKVREVFYSGASYGHLSQYRTILVHYAVLSFLSNVSLIGSLWFSPFLKGTEKSLKIFKGLLIALIVVPTMGAVFKCHRIIHQSDQGNAESLLSFVYYFEKYFAVNVMLLIILSALAFKLHQGKMAEKAISCLALSACCIPFIIPTYHYSTADTVESVFRGIAVVALAGANALMAWITWKHKDKNDPEES